MSVKRFCDRCGKEADTCDFSVLHVDDFGVIDCKFSDVGNVELCDECRKALVDWLDAGKGEGK